MTFEEWRREQERLTAEETPLGAPLRSDPRTPDDAASDRNIAEAAGVDPVTARVYRDALAPVLEERALDETTRATPRLRRWLAQGDNLAVARDDVENLSPFERFRSDLNRETRGGGDSLLALALGPAAYALAGVEVARDLRGGDPLQLNQRRRGQEDVELSTLQDRLYEFERNGASPLTPEETARLEALSNRTGADDYGTFIVGPTMRLLPQIEAAVGAALDGSQEGAYNAALRRGDPAQTQREQERNAQSLVDALSRVTPTPTPYGLGLRLADNDAAQASGALRSLVFSNSPAWLESAVRGAEGYFGQGYRMERGGLYAELRGEGLSVEAAGEAADAYAATATGIELAGAVTGFRLSALGGLGARMVGRRVLIEGARPLARAGLAAGASVAEGAIEQAAEESLQEAAQILYAEYARQDEAGDADLNRVWRDAWTPEGIERVLRAGYIGAQGGAGMATPAAGINLAADIGAVRQAERTARAFSDLTAAAQASRLAERHGPSFEAAVDAASDGAQVWLDADRVVEHFQGLGQDAVSSLAAMGVARDELVSAIAAHGAIQMPLARFAGRILRDPQLAPLQEHARTDPTAATIAEARAAGDALKQTADEVSKEMLEAARAQNETASLVEQRFLAAAQQSAGQGGMSAQVARPIGRMLRAMATTMLTRAGGGEGTFSQRMDAEFRRLAEHGFGIKGPRAPAAPDDDGANLVAQGGRAGPPVREEVWTPPEGVRLSDRERKIAEMAVNGAGNAWIAEEMDVSNNTIASTLSAVKAKLGGKALWDVGQRGTPNVNSVTGEATATIEQLVHARAALRAAGHIKVNATLAERYGVSPQTIKVRLWLYDKERKAAEREAQKRSLEPPSAAGLRRAWVEAHVVTRPVPGGAPGDFQHGFTLSSGRRVEVGIGDDGNGAASIEWTFMDRMKAQDADDSATLYADGDERLTASEWRELRTAIQAIVEADAATHERPAYMFTPQRRSNERANMKMLAELGGLGYHLDNDQGSVYLFHPDAGVAANGRIKPQDGWSPAFEEPVQYDSQEARDEAQSAFYAATEAIAPAVGNPRGIAEATRRERQEAARLSRAAAGGQDVPGNGPGRGFGSGEDQSGELGQSRGGAPIWFSAVERIIEQSRAARASGAQWWATISKAPGVKREELEWIGLEDWLTAHEGQVSRDDVLAFVRANGVQVEETVLGDQGASGDMQARLLPLLEERERLERSLDPLMPAVAQGTLTHEQTRQAGETRSRILALSREIIPLQQQIADASRATSTKWSQYTLPGGREYRELLLRLPERDTITRAAAQAPDGWGDTAGGNQGFVERGNTGADFRSSHFDQPNILAHVRFNERVDTNGKRTLFIEELQSDWHQAGRERGYKRNLSPEENARFEALTQERSKLYFDRQTITNNYQRELRRTPVLDDLRTNDRERFSELSARIKEVEQELQPFEVNRSSLVPDAPFKNNAWAALALKRMIRWAAENDFEQIAWTRGQHQIERFNLSHALGELHARPTSDGRVSFTPQNGRRDARQALQQFGEAGKEGDTLMTREQAISAFGSEAGGRMFDQALSQDKNVFAGEDLNIGGEGMRAFYDRILVNIANDLGKKFGARVGEAEIVAGLREAPRIADGPNGPIGDLGPANTQTVHALPITESMREAAMEGQALFQQPGAEGRRGALKYEGWAPGQFGDAMVKLFDEWDPSTPLHEVGGHLFHLILESMALDPEAPADIRAMWADTLNWWGVDQATWSRLDFKGREPYFERWARTFEAYLMEGKAPSLQLRDVFQTFMRWLLAVYRDIRSGRIRLNHNLSPEITGVFDRLLATDAQIAEARAMAGADVKLRREHFRAMSDEEWAGIEQAYVQAHEAQDADLRARVMAAFARKHKRWYRAEREARRDEAMRDVDAYPARRAEAWLSASEWIAVPPVDLDEDAGPVPPGLMLAMPEGLPEMTLDAGALAAEWPGVDLPASLKPRTDLEAVLTEAMSLKRAGKDKQAQRLWAFVKANGGIDLRGLGEADRARVMAALGSGRRLPGLINNASGKSPEEILTLAARAGYFGEAAAKALRNLQSGELGQFAGLGARTADRDALARAKRELAQNPDDGDRIRRETGWFLGPDRKWRFEINDSAARIRVDLTQPFSGTMQEFLEHPKLFEAYPTLAGVRVEYGANQYQLGGGSFFGDNRIQVESSQGALSTTLHEIQHWIQRLEAFAQGSSGTLAALQSRYPKEYQRRFSQRWSQMMKRLGFWARLSPEARSDTALVINRVLVSEGYRKSAGEVEARDVEDRAMLTDEERRTTPPALTRTDDLFLEDRFLMETLEGAGELGQPGDDDWVALPDDAIAPPGLQYQVSLQGGPKRVRAVPLGPAPTRADFATESEFNRAEAGYRRNVADHERARAFVEQLRAAQDKSNASPDIAELIAALVADLEGSRQVYSALEPGALPESQRRASARQWFEARGIDLGADKATIRAQIEAALRADAEDVRQVHPDEAAPFFGFGSGDELVRALAALKPRAQAIEERIDALTNSDLGDQGAPEQVERGALEAAHVEATARAIEMELAAITKAAGGRVVPANKRAQEAAEDMILDMTIAEIGDGSTFLAGERRAAKRAMEAMAKGDMAEAARQKSRQLISFHLYRAALKAHKRATRIRERWDRYAANQTTRAAIGSKHIEQIDAILDMLETGRVNFRPEQTLEEWVAERQAADEADLLTFNHEVLTATLRRPLKQLQWADVQAVDDALKNIETIGRNVIKLKNAREAQRIADIQETLRGRLQSEWGALIERNAKREAPDDARMTLGDNIAHLHANLIKLDYLFRYLDGLKDGGPFMELMNEAQTAESDAYDRTRTASRQFLEIVAQHYTTKEFAQLATQRIHIDAIEGARTKSQIIAYALNLGSEYNRNALLVGEKWSETQLQAVIANLDDRDWGFVQALWNYVGQWKEESFALDERTRGSRPPEVLAQPFTTPTGRTLSGGYWPVAFSARRSNKAAEREAQDTIIGVYGASFRQAATKRGRLMSRRGTGKQALSDDWMTILARHANDSIRDITHRELVITLRRIKADAELRAMIARAAGKDAVKALDEWVFRLAQRMPARSFGSWDALPRYLRRAGTGFAMGFKVSVATLNLMGHLQAIPRNGVIAQMKQAGLSVAVGFPDLLRRHAMALATGERQVSKRVAFVFERSAMMRNRADSFDRDFSDAKADLVGRRQGSLLPKQIEDSLQILNQYTDRAVAVPTWLAAYESAVAGKVEGVKVENVSDDSAAVNYADSVVRATISAGSTKDLAALIGSNNEWQRMFTMFMGWANAFYNQLTLEQFPGVWNGKISKARFAANMIWIWLLPSVITAMFYGDTEREEGEDEIAYWARLATTVVVYPLQTVPFLRDIITATVQGWRPQTPYASVVERSQRFVDAIERQDERMMVKQGYLLGAQIMGLPSQFYTTGDYLVDLAQGEEDITAPDALEEALMRDTR